MEPLSLAFAGLSSIAGAGASKSAQDANNYYNLLNYYQREQERYDRIKAANAEMKVRDEEKGEAKLGQTDAMGNRVHFVPGQGWVTDLSADSKSMLEDQKSLNRSQMQEKRDQLNIDAPLARKQLQNTFDEQQGAANQLDSFSRELRFLKRDNPDAEGARLYDAQQNAVNDAYKGETAAISRQGIRTGASNTGQILKDVAAKKAQQLAQLKTQSMLQGEKSVDDRYNSRQGQLANLIQAYTGLASKPIGGNYTPVGVDVTGKSDAGGSLNAFMNALAQLQQNDGSKEYIAAKGMKGGEMDYMKPDFGMANGLASFGSALGSFGRNQSAKNVGAV